MASDTVQAEAPGRDADDLPLAAAVPAGHGHLYTTDYVDAWAQVLQPPSWTTERRDALQQIIASEQ